MARMGDLRPARWLLVLGGVTAAIWLAVLVASVSAAAPRGARASVGGRAGGGAGATAAPVDDARGEVVLRYLDTHPTEFAKGREMLAERLAASTSPPERERWKTEARRLEDRFRAAADARLAERTETARALAEEGDLEGMARALAQWPEGLAGAPQEADATRLADSLREEMLGPGRRLLEEAEGAFARWDAGADATGVEARELHVRVDEVLGHAPREPVQRPRLVDLRARLEARLSRVAKEERERLAREALSQALARADADDGPGVRAALEALGRAPGGATDVSSLVAQVLARGREVDDELAIRLSVVEGKPWAAVIDGRLVVALVETPPSPRSVFAPVPLRAANGAFVTGDLSDLLAAEPDLERAASWLLLVGIPDVAATLAPTDGPARRLLFTSGRAPRPPRAPAGEAWGAVDRRIPFLVRLPGAPAPAGPTTSDPLLVAWVDAIRASGRRAPSGAKPSPALLAARAAFLVQDLVGAWTALEQAAGSAPKDPEVATLRAHVLELLAAPARTEGVDLLALCEARRAWDLDTSIPGASRVFAEGCLRFRSRHPGPYADALTTVAVAAGEEAARLGRAGAAVLSFVGERRLAENRPKDAAPLLRRAVREAPEDGEIALLLARAEDAIGEPKKAIQALERARDLLGERFPEWAQEMLDRLSRR